ncbi:hypothetical protein, partial [Candidatus Phytoplasma fabacearum]
KRTKNNPTSPQLQNSLPGINILMNRAKNKKRARKLQTTPEEPKAITDPETEIRQCCQKKKKKKGNCGLGGARRSRRRRVIVGWRRSHRSLIAD